MIKDTKLLKIQLKALKTMKSNFDKLFQKAFSKQEKEAEKFNKKVEGLSKDELAEAYGWEQITWDEYQEALKQLDQNENEVQNKVTPITEYVRMLRNNIRDLEIEIFELEEELGIVHVAPLSRDERRKMLGLEPKN